MVYDVFRIGRRELNVLLDHRFEGKVDLVSDSSSPERPRNLQSCPGSDERVQHTVTET